MKGTLYVDNKGRGTLYVPLVFVVIDHFRKPKVVLDNRKLKRRLLDWRGSRTSIARVLDYPEIDEEDIDAITGLCFDNKLDEAKSYCIDIFDYYFDEHYEIHFEGGSENAN